MINYHGNVYWFENVATGRRLDCHRGEVYTWPTNGDHSQEWYVIAA